MNFTFILSGLYVQEHRQGKCTSEKEMEDYWYIVSGCFDAPVVAAD